MRAGAFLVLAGLLSATCLSAAEAKKAPPAKKVPPAPAGKEGPSAGTSGAAATTCDVDAWGTIKAVKGTEFWELTYLQIEGTKASKKVVFFKPSADVEFLRDKLVPVTDLKEGESVWIFAKRFEQEAQAAGGFMGTDRQMKNVTVAAVGTGIRVNTAHKDPKDASMRWYEVSVSKAGATVTVAYDSQQYKMTMVPRAQIVRREKEGDASLLKNGMLVAVCLETSDERPETGKTADAKKASYAAKSVAILDPRLKASYPMLQK